MIKHKLDDEGFAAMIGASVSAVRKLRLMHGRPSLERAYEIEQATKYAVRLQDWLYEPGNRAGEAKRWRDRRAKQTNGARRERRGASP